MFLLHCFSIKSTLFQFDHFLLFFVSDFLENLKQKQRARLKDKMNNVNAQPIPNGQDHQKGKENNANGKAAPPLQGYEERVNTQTYPATTVPVAALRNTPTIPTLQITKPSPAPRLSLGQGSPIKLTPPIIQQTNKPDDTEGYKNDIDFTTPKSGFNTLDNTVIENNNTDITVCANPADLKNGNIKYHGNLTQDYLNSSTTSGSDHFMRACDILNSSFHSTSSSCENEPFRNHVDPPPLPPKPKVLPIKPSNWGHNLVTDDALINMRMQEVSLPEVGQENPDRTKRTVYLDQPSSSFV